MTSERDDAYESLIQFLYRAPVGLVQIQIDGQIEMLNPMSAQLLMPLSPDGNLSNFFDVIQASAPELRAMCVQFPEKSGVICEALRILLKASIAGLDTPEVLSISILKVDGGRAMVVIADATQEVQREQVRLTRRLDNAVRIDALTQLPNRAAVSGLLQQMWKRPRAAQNDESAVLLINFDRFKQVNDSFGNVTGDRVISMMADRLRAALRSGQRGIGGAQTGESIARVGGDEFAVLLDGLSDFSAAKAIAARLLKSLGEPYQIEVNEIIGAISIAIVPISQLTQDVDDVLRDASIAMAAAKASGGGQFMVFEEPMRELAVRRGGVEAELRVALDRGQFFVVYQPVVGITTNGGIDRSAGIEALVRWQHPERGVVGPIHFIAIAEESGLINAIGEEVLRSACRDFMMWQVKLGPLAPRLLAVNLSRAQLNQANLGSTVQSILVEVGMSPEQLQLEITESLAAQDENIQCQLRSLKSLGIKLALDDFGTGYSSLSSLHLLPIDTVKIDRSFVCLADTSFHHEVLIEATVKVARSLGMSTVAEGIETEQQANIVRRQGCDKAQGYLYSQPLTASELSTWILGNT